MKDGMLEYSDWEAIRQRRSFLMVPVRRLEQSGQSVLIEIADNPIVATEKRTRRFLERENKAENGGKAWRWPAGGSVIFLKLKDCTVLLLINRDLGAPSYKNHDTIPAGVGADESEILYPKRVATREGWEEPVIVTPKGVIYPVFQNDDYGFTLEMKSIIWDSVRTLRSSLGSAIVPEKIVPANVRSVDLPDKKYLEIVWRGESVPCEATLNFDPETGGIDVLVAFMVDLSRFRLDEITVLDGEVVGGNLINRRIHAYEVVDLRPTGKIVAAWQAGKRQQIPEVEFPYQFVPHTAQIMEALKRI